MCFCNYEVEETIILHFKVVNCSWLIAKILLLDSYAFTTGEKRNAWDKATSLNTCLQMQCANEYLKMSLQSF